MIEDVYLLVVPSPQTNVDPEEEEKRAQAAKAERLENAELLNMRGQAEESTGTQCLENNKPLMTMDIQIIRHSLRECGHL
jgi:hypothetical protein